MHKPLILALLLALPATAATGGLQVAVGATTLNTTTGNQAVAGLAFQPKSILITGINAIATQNTASVTANYGFGATVSTSNQAAFFHRRNDATTTSFGHHTSGANSVFVSAAGAIVLEIDLVSFDAAGFTFNIVSTPGTAFLLHWMALGGTEFQANLVQFDSPTSTGSAAFTGMGFKADALIFLTAGMTAAIPTTDGNARPGWGFVDGTLGQAALGIKQVSGANTSRRAQSTAHAIYIPDTSAMWLEAAVTAIGNDGATLNYTVVQATGVKIWALGLRGLRAKVGSFNQATSTGNQSTTAVERQPTAILMASACAPTTSGQQNNGIMSLGAAAGANQNHKALATTSGNNTTGQASWNNQIMSCYAAGAPTLFSQAAFVSFDPRGFTLNNGTVDGTPREIIYMTMSPLPVSRLLISKR